MDKCDAAKLLDSRTSKEQLVVVVNSLALTCPLPQNREEGANKWTEGGAKGGGRQI